VRVHVCGILMYPYFFFSHSVGVLVQTGAFLDVTALEDSAGPMGSDSTGMSSSSKLGFPSGGGVGNRVTTAHDPAELAVFARASTIEGMRERERERERGKMRK